METVHSPSRPAEVAYNRLSSNLAECWIRKNIKEEILPADTANTENEVEEGAVVGLSATENLEYVYEEVYFQTAATEEEVRSDLEGFWALGQEWNLPVPMTQEQRIEQLETELTGARAALAESQMNNDMAIAELTMVMAMMMGGE